MFQCRISPDVVNPKPKIILCVSVVASDCASKPEWPNVQQPNVEWFGSPVNILCLTTATSSGADGAQQ